MTLNQLNYFIETCRQENITKAAEHLHISQPSLTVAIKKLEEELGVSLFHRIKKRIEPTDLGRYYYDHLLPLLVQLEDLNKEMIDEGKHSNSLKIGIPPMIGSVLFPDIYSKFTKQYPNIKLEIIEVGTLKMIDYILDDTLDLSLLLEETPVKKSILSKAITSRSYSLYVKKDHPLSHNATVSVKDLRNEPLILLNKDYVIRRMVNESFKKENISPKVIMETTQINTIQRFLHEGLASTILIDGTLQAGSDYVSIPITDMPQITFTLVWKADHFLTSSAEKLLSFIGSHYSTNL